MTTKKGVSVSIGEATAAPVAQETELEQLRRENAELRAKSQSSGSARVYAPSETPLEVAQIVASDPKLILKLYDICVKRVPGSPITEQHPYGTAVTVMNKANTTKLNAMKDGIDRGDYIKLRGLGEQVFGVPMNHQAPRPLNEDQINKVLRPVLDNLHKLGLFSW